MTEQKPTEVLRTSKASRRRTAVTLVASGGLAAALLATTMGTSNATEGPSPSQHRKPTVVLVHGAFADSTSWNGVVEKLRKDGYPVVAAANPLRGLSSDAAYVRNIVASIDGPVVLAGHSYGGAVITNAATGNPQVKGLVYLAAFVPDQGESANELAARFEGSTLPQAVRTVPVDNADGTQGQDVYIQEQKFPQQFAHDVPRRVAEGMAVTQRPVTLAALDEKSGAPAWKNVPSWVLVADEDRNIPPQAQLFMAKRAHAHVKKVDASHAVTVSEPKVVADFIEDAARTVR
ncbi:MULTISPECIES: alpha/beta hydrolase [Streptomyces]|uniref:Alpha/beta hydrolase n=1 Tax=Streptomyces edwardsiae TaxID=3075527 RepID=A0ABU2PTZ6_9ACTN|nr:alpha/beta hydrolase [Streptomyces sp. DSM 41636]MDT0395637.1 alpha/beta hydrolase [Streptomyces sp. DSM 41636]